MTIAQDGILWPLRFAATSYVLRVTANAVTEDLTFPSTGSLTTTRNHYMSGDNQADASTDGGQGDLFVMLENTLNSHSQTVGFIIADTTGDGSNQVKITCDVDFTILWTHANTTLDAVGAYWGFDVTGDDASTAQAFTVTNQTQGIWFPNQTRSEDSRDRQPYVGATARSISGLQRTSRLATPKKEREISYRLLDKGKALEEYEAATEPTGSFEKAWVDALSLGRRFRFYEDMTSRSASSYSVYRSRSMADPLDRDELGRRVRWRLDLEMVRADD